MKQSKSTTSGWSVTHCLPFALIAVVGGTLLAGYPAKPGLQAALLVTSDSDADGLVDPQEKVLGTSPFQSDSDLDGWEDAEEFARQKSPLFSQSHPGPEEIQIAMSAHGTEGMLHVLIGLYSPDENLRNKQVAFGPMVHGRIVPIPTEQWLPTADLTILPGRAPSSRIALIDIPVDEQWVHANRDLSFFATASLSGGGRVLAAASIHLKSVDGVVVLVTADPTVPPTNMSMMSSAGGHGGIYVPLPLGGDGDWPTGWTPGQVCFQTTSTVGAAGASVTQQVTSASCQSGFEGACPGSCSSSVGTTFTTIDPVVLIGG